VQHLTKGYEENPEETLRGAMFDVAYDEMVIVKDIEMFSLCEHHLLPFFGKVHVAYIPHGKVIGLSKVPRLVDVFARRLQVQERLTTQIAEVIESVIKYVLYYHDDRTHLGLAKDTPAGRPTAIRPGVESKIQSLPRLGGLHHRYTVAE
jgi:GTP cyclohydrolase I